MRKTLLFTLLAMLAMTQIAAQEYEYVPFVREGVKWICDISNGPLFQECSKHFFTLELKGDVEINGNVYMAMHKYSSDCIDPESDTVLVYLREEDKVVYGIVPDGKTYPDYPIGMDGGADLLAQIAAGEEFLLYDFNKPVEFIQNGIANPNQEQPVITDLTDIAGKKAKRFISHYYNHNFGDFCMIEGVGFDGMWLWYPLGYSNTHHISLSHVIENGEVIYRSEQYKFNRPSQLMQLVREGVQWVNERIIISKGDTTSYYYNYEFHGTNFRDYPNCYTYSGETLDTEQATLAAVFVTNYNRLEYFISTYNNNPFGQTLEEGRDLIKYGYFGDPIYCFAETGCDIEWKNPVNYYILCQKEPFLNRQNFVEVEPVEIEGYQCRRYAYLGEDGEPLAYYVEGIGFDSRDMGDLLTPFTRKPDPDADYQEYCGLSHVIKDGKIIYKGMRYRGEAEESVVGDVNSDGRVDINDVAILIDMLLNTGGRYTMPYDVDNNGNVGVSDVTTLIDLLLTQEQ